MRKRTTYPKPTKARCRLCGTTIYAMNAKAAGLIQTYRRQALLLCPECWSRKYGGRRPG